MYVKLQVSKNCICRELLCNSEGEQSHGTRQSAVTDQSEDTLTDAEKLKLIRNSSIEDSENEDICKNDFIDMFGSYDEDLKETAKETIVRKHCKVVLVGVAGHPFER